MTTRLTRRLRRYFPSRVLILDSDWLWDYPDDVRTSRERHRWDLAHRAAVEVATSIGGDEVTVLLATRSLYESDIPTSS